MKKIVLSFVWVLICTVVGFAQGIKFETGSWNEMLAKAKAENKLIFVDVYTQWCGPCKNVAKNVFPQQKLGDVYNAQFINFQIDAESPEGKEFVKQYPVPGYPTFFYINGEGVVINKAVGGMDVDGFLQEAKMISVYARYGGREKMMAAIKNGTATEDMYRDYYLSANKKEKPKAVNLYLMHMSSEKLMDVNNKLIEEMSLYDKDLMIRLIDEIVKVGNSEKFNDSKFAETFNFNIGFSVQFDMTTFLQESIKQGNEEWLNELLKLKERFSAYKIKSLDGDLNIRRGRGIFFATSEYIRLCYMSYNRVKGDEFKTLMTDYMTNLITKNPADSLLKDNRLLDILKSNESTYRKFLLSNFLRTGNVTAHNIIAWTDYFWKISPSDKKTKQQCSEWISYAFRLNPYISEVAVEAADLLARIGNIKTAITLLETSLQKQEEIHTDAKTIRPIELKLQDLRNGKL